MTALDDPGRLRAFADSGLDGTIPLEGLERIARMVTRLVGVQTALINVVGSDSQTTVAAEGDTTRFKFGSVVPLNSSFCQHVVTDGGPFEVADARMEPRLDGNLSIDAGVIAYLGVPLRSPEGHVLGALCAIDPQPREWTDADRSAMDDLGAMVADELALRAAKREVEALARRDSLTGLANRRAWEEQCPIELERARRDGSPLSVVLFDLDGFKQVNDTQGHAAGDAILREIGERWPPLVRAPDVLARLGGDEFGLLMTNAPLPPAAAAAARLAGAHPAGVTVSWGAAQWRPPETLEELLERADAELYGAKARR